MIDDKKIINEIIESLNHWKKEYSKEKNQKAVTTINLIIRNLKKNNINNAYLIFRDSGLSYDLPQTYEKLQWVKIRTEAKYDISWGKRPGKYYAYRIGYITNNKRGIFFSADKEGAEPYRNGSEVKKYLIQIKKPFIAKNQRDVTIKLNNKYLNDLWERREDTSKWMRRMDIAIVNKLKVKGYDSLVYTKPMPPANRELCVFKKSNVIGRNL